MGREKNQADGVDLDEKKREALAERERTLEERERQFDMDLKKLNLVRSSFKEIDATTLRDGDALHINEIGKANAGIEVMTDMHDIKKDINAELFMNEYLTVQVFDDGKQGSLDVIVVTVNGVNQPIIRGRDQKIRRKYVEALARSRITDYEQSTPDPNRPENIQMRPKNSLTYPFSVREDRNPRGRAWLEAIINQPV